MKIVLVGAGSAQFGCGTLGDIFCSKQLQGAEITLLDINAKAVDAVLQVAKASIKTHGLNFTVNATTERKAAFKNADFIISSIEVGDRFTLWDEDWKIPLQYGIRQVYGENGGPGGVFHSLRIVPVILDIVKDAIEICPDAYIFNFSNPMTAICTTVKRVYPQARFIGLCHEIAVLNHWLPSILSTKIEDISFKAAGLNHFSCVVELHDKKTGKNLYPDLLKNAEAFLKQEGGFSDVLDKYRETGDLNHSEKYYRNQHTNKGHYEWADKKLVKFMLENYQLLPITLDSHFGEYLGWAWDIVDHRGILDFYDVYKLMMRQETRHEIHLEMSERVVPIIDGILGDENFQEPAVNILNEGLIPDLPSWIAVEVPALVNKNGLSGVSLPPLSKGYLGLLRSYCSVYDLTAEAIIHKSKNTVIQALLANPVVHQTRDLPELVERMIAQQSPWLDYLK